MHFKHSSVCTWQVSTQPQCNRLLPKSCERLSSPGRRGCPVMPMGAMPRLFMAVAQAVGSDIGNPIRMESRLRFLPPSVERNIKVIKGLEQISALPSEALQCQHPKPELNPLSGKSQEKKKTNNQCCASRAAGIWKTP